MNDDPTTTRPHLARRFSGLALRGVAALTILLIQFLLTGFVCQSVPMRKLE